MDKCNAALGLFFGAGRATSVDSVDALATALMAVSDRIRRIIAELPPTAEVRVRDVSQEKLPFPSEVLVNAVGRSTPCAKHMTWT